MQKQKVESNVCIGSLLAALAETGENECMAASGNLDGLVDRLDSLTARLRGYNSASFDEVLEEGTPGLAGRVSTLSEGYAGGLLVELEEMKREEQAECAFILDRARSLAWQAVRHTPGFGACPKICRAWILRAALWARHRALYELADEMEQLAKGLEQALPLLTGRLNQSLLTLSPFLPCQRQI